MKIRLEKSIRSSEGSSTLGRLNVEGLFDIIILQLYSLVNHFGLVGHGEFFHRVFRFLFNNTSQCYLVFAFLFSYSLSFIFIVYYLSLCCERPRPQPVFIGCWAKLTWMGGVVLLPLEREVRLVIFPPLD